ncbi:hypothetical protein [Halosimplex salinum]|uniref:hypothetical protein n=1 Tax=Halosimplex salinum TaxID=1710538 RepID=UPI000F4721B5|nr:hypothetical protein [Halosimplex salinum]
MGQTRSSGSFGDDTVYEYDETEVRTLVESDFLGFADMRAAAEGVLRVLSDSVVGTTPVTTRGYDEYTIVDVDAIGDERKVRPVNTDLFIQEVDEFQTASSRLSSFLGEISAARGVTEAIRDSYPEFVDQNRINEVLYTISQGVGIGLDALSSSKNKARKHAGLRFESVIEGLVDEMGIANDNHFFKIPIGESGDEYSCEVDMILGPHDNMRSTKTALDPEETLVSIKTTSKDRMTKIFTDKMLMSQFLEQDVDLLAFFLHDVQRKGEDGINSTFVSNNYYIYYEYLTPMEGTYFIDPPSKITEDGYENKLSTFKDLILEDIWTYC